MSYFSGLHAELSDLGLLPDDYEQPIVNPQTRKCSCGNDFVPAKNFHRLCQACAQRQFAKPIYGEQYVPNFGWVGKDYDEEE